MIAVYVLLVLCVGVLVGMLVYMLASKRRSASWQRKNKFQERLRNAILKGESLR
jgi:sensor c-di-GMP phosphodiesterase-like protein